MEWVAQLYDLDGDGVISPEDLEDVIFSVSNSWESFSLCVTNVIH